MRTENHFLDNFLKASKNLLNCYKIFIFALNDYWKSGDLLLSLASLGIRSNAKSMSIEQKKLHQLKRGFEINEKKKNNYKNSEFFLDIDPYFIFSIRKKTKQ